MLKADTPEELADYTNRVKQAGRKHVVDFEETYYHQAARLTPCYQLENLFGC